jgi:hypothetical protein
MPRPAASLVRQPALGRPTFRRITEALKLSGWDHRLPDARSSSALLSSELPVVLATSADRDRIDSTSGQVPGLKLRVWADPEPGTIVKVDDQSTVLTDIDRGE